MAKDKRKHKGKVYRRLLFWRVRAAIIIVIFLLIEYVILAITHVPLFIVLIVLFNLMLIPILWFAYGEGWRERLIVADEGITFVHFGGEIFTDWDNLRLKRSFWKEYSVVLEFIDLPQDITQNRILRWLKLLPENIPLEAYVAHIPLTFYMRDIRKTELGRDLMRYAPNLFDEDKVKTGDDFELSDEGISEQFSQQAQDSQN